MARIRLSVVGLGLALTPHVASLRELSDRAEVVWWASRGEARARAFAAASGLPATTDVERAIGDPSIDAVLILTPPNTHLELAEAAFAAGKHVLLEKPLDVSLDRARRIVEASEAAGRALGVVLQHRFREASLRLAEVVEAGGLGRIEAASTTVPWWRPQSYYDEPGRGTRARDGGGVLLTQAIHTLDLFRSLVGPVEVVAARALATGAHRMETEDYAAALIRLPGGRPGTIVATTAFAPGDPERIEIVGSEGSARLLGDELRVALHSGEVETVGGGGGTGGGADPMAFSHDAHRRLIADFLDAVEAGRAPRASGAEALRTQELIETILAAS